MKYMKNALLSNSIMVLRICITVFVTVVLMACTSQQYYEGLKAGRRATCLEYPESEFEDCMDETKTSYQEYKRQRQEIVVE